MSLPEVVLYTKPGCCLCDKVKAQLQSIKKFHNFVLHEINILDDDKADEQFKEEIPVIFINGRKAFKYHLDEPKFLKRLTRGAKNGT